MQNEPRTDYAKILLFAVGIGFSMAVLLLPSMWLVKNDFERQKAEHVREVDGLLREISGLQDKLIICEGS